MFGVRRKRKGNNREAKGKDQSNIPLSPSLVGREEGTILLQVHVKSNSSASSECALQGCPLFHGVWGLAELPLW
jgi:hypothetical protein